MTRLLSALTALLRDTRALADARDALVTEVAWRDAAIARLLDINNAAQTGLSEALAELQRLQAQADALTEGADGLRRALLAHRDCVSRGDHIRLAAQLERAEARLEEVGG